MGETRRKVRKALIDSLPFGSQDSSEEKIVVVKERWQRLKII